MKLHQKLFFGIAAITGITWLLLVLLLCEIRGAGIVGLVFGVLGFVLACGWNLVPSQNSAGSDPAAFAIPLAGSAVFLGLSTAVNTLLIVWASVTDGGSLGAILLALTVNILLLSGFAAFAWFSHSYLEDLAAKKHTAQSKTENTARISSMLGILLATTEDAEARNAVLRLKEAVDHSSNTTDAEGAAMEQAVFRQVAGLMKTQDRDTVIREADQALRLWRARNARKH